MAERKPMPLLLIEDDVAECVKFKNCAVSRTDIKFVGMTGSSAEGLELAKTWLPEGIILDLELHRGKGSGIQFLTALKSTDLSLRPIIVVTTNSPSSIVHNHVHDIGADLVFFKRQSDYCPDLVINTLLTLRKSLHSAQSSGTASDIQTTESPGERRKRIMQRIEAELMLIGISARYKGHLYAMDAIFLLINNDGRTNSDAVLYEVAKNHGRTYSAVIRAIQTAIVDAWEPARLEELQRLYAARISAKNGTPTPTEFIQTCAKKIRDSI